MNYDPSVKDNTDVVIKIHLYDLNWMKKYKMHKSLNKPYKNCLELIEFFINWRLWIKEY